MIGKDLLDLQDEEILSTMNVNAISHFWTIKAFLPEMIEHNRGHIVTIASLAGTVGVNKLTDYCASKYAAVGLDAALRLELATNGYSKIKTTVVCPWFIDTGMFFQFKEIIVPLIFFEFIFNFRHVCWLCSSITCSR